MSRVIALLSGILFCSSFSSAQIIYQPLQYQYGSGTKFYYGGSDPHVIANGLADVNGRCGAEGYHADAPTLVYCDCMPGLNARVYGMNAADAANEAAMNMPRYFRMRDVLVSAIREPDGSLLVPPQMHPEPAHHGTIVIKPVHHTHPTTTQPTQPASTPAAGPVYIFPKELLDRPLHPHSDPVSLAQ